MIIKIKKFHPDAVIPAFQTAGAACVDVVATEITQKPFNKVIVKLGFGLDLPEGYKACIVPRSSFTHQTFVLANSPTQMDSKTSI